MSININEHEPIVQKPKEPEKSPQRKWPLIALGAVLMYVAPTVNSILQQFIAAKWTIAINISGFQLNIVLLICELIFTWIITGVSFIAGMFLLPDLIASLLMKKKTNRLVRIVLTIVFPLLWVWNHLSEEWYYRNNKK